MNRESDTIFSRLSPRLKRRLVLLRIRKAREISVILLLLGVILGAGCTTNDEEKDRVLAVRWLHDDTVGVSLVHPANYSDDHHLLKILYMDPGNYSCNISGSYWINFTVDWDPWEVPSLVQMDFEEPGEIYLEITVGKNGTKDDCFIRREI